MFQNGECRACGRNDEGQLGDGTFVGTSKENPAVPVKLSAEILDLGAGPSAQSVFFVTDGDVYAAGLNDRYQLGMDVIGSQELPKRVLFEGTVEIARVSASGTHAVAMGRTLLDTDSPTWVSAWLRDRCLAMRARTKEEASRTPLTFSVFVCHSVAHVLHGKSDAVSNRNSNGGECGSSQHPCWCSTIAVCAILTACDLMF